MMKVVRNFCFFLLVAVVIFSPQTEQQTAYLCQVDNCMTCSYINFCGICDNNFMLMQNTTTGKTYCAPVSCNLTNCQTCYQNNTCSICDVGYSVTNTGSCINSSSSLAPPSCNNAWCLSCATNSTCALCKFGYNLQSDGNCYPNYGASRIGTPLGDQINCQSGFTGYSCQFCNSGYMVSPSYACLAAPQFDCSNISNCQTCSSATQCTLCDPEYYTTSTGQCVPYECDVEYCSECSDNTTCQACLPLYELVNNTCMWKSYACNVENCALCLYYPENCVACAEGYTPSGSNTTGTSCVPITPPTGVTNCAVFGTMIQLTSSLPTGCIVCEQTYVNVGGYCVANLTLANYTCNIDNCVYCIQDNMCGRCAEGYTVYLGSSDYCMKNYSPYPGCALTPVNPYLLDAFYMCQMCRPGYTLVDYVCIQTNTDITCQIEGCEYCLDDDVCQDCRAGYTNTNGTCEADCDISNCFICSGAEQCQYCEQGYVLSDNSTSCINGSTLNATCPSTVTNCQTCNALSMCTNCSSNYALNSNGTCCLAAPHDVAYCVAYESVCSNTCIQCSKGTFMVGSQVSGGTQCLGFPCKIQNCAYCYNSNNTCLVCSDGFRVVNGACQAYSNPCNVQNCYNCSSTGQCLNCIQGYITYNGQCVCDFQNCLECLGNQFCTKCAFPTFGPLVSSAGCVPEIIVYSLCNVSNCQFCTRPGLCAQCDPGYSLQSNGQCLQTACGSTTNCELCSENGEFCFLPKAGFIQENLFSRNAIQLPSNYSCQVDYCQYCSNTSSTTCLQCLPFYNLIRGQCDPISCTDNCVLCYEKNNCTVCEFTYYLTTSFTCAPLNSSIPDCKSIDPYCTGCVTKSVDGVSTNMCTSCLLGLTPTSDNQACEPIECTRANCRLCIESGISQICLVCDQGYFLNSYYQCVSYSPAIPTPNCSDVYNCILCAADNECALCALNWNNTAGTCTTNIEQFCSVQDCTSCTDPSTCHTCISNYAPDSLGSCIPLCGITNCSVCDSLTTCGQCDPSFDPSENYTLCVCPTNQQIINGSCGCPNGTTLSTTTNQCVDCSGITYCILCNVADQCAQCQSPFVVDNSSCSCPDTFVEENGTCVCPNGTLYNTIDKACYPCSIGNCSFCFEPQNQTMDDQCAQCAPTFQQANDTCQCGETYLYNSTSNSCYCAAGSLINIEADPNTCVPCNVTSCAYCTEDNQCKVCLTNYQVNETDFSCYCPEGFIVYNNSCIACNVQNCDACSQTDYCVNCSDTYTLTNGTCSCSSMQTQYNNTCYACNIPGCTMCQQDNVCSSCIENLYTLIDQTCIPCFVNNCTQCSSPNYCQTCDFGMQVSSSGSRCLTCNISNCLSCDLSNQCFTCQSGYQLTSTRAQCITCNVVGCASCSSENTCTKCQNGFVLSNGICNVCSYPCSTCSSTTNTTTNSNCLTCVYPFSSSAAANNTCYTCNVANCQTCSSSNTNLCSACLPNYKLSSNNSTCTYSSACDINCANCAFNQTCKQCVGGYTINPSNPTTCLACTVSNCTTCSQNDVSVCRKCASGFYLVNGLCNSCPSANCDTCTSTSCITFKNGLIPITINGVVMPAACDSNCLSCSTTNPNFCVKCDNGFGLDKTTGFCVTCNPSCKTCSPSNPNTCLSCYSNAIYSASSNTCTPCSSANNCLTCNSQNSSQCTSCPNGLYLSNSKCVAGCPANCITCTGSQTCTTCATGYSANSFGVCLPCTNNCRVCSGSAQAVCLACGDGFFLSITSGTSKCVSCPANCQSCSSSATCLTCMAGYSLNFNLQCVQNCPFPCATCTSPSTTACTTCLAGYQYDSTTNACTPVTDCNSNNGICYVCPLGSILSQNQCMSCSTSNCARCSISSTNSSQQTCVSCMPGYYLNTANNTCASCPVGCATCSSGSSCQTCISTYTISQNTVSGTPNICTKCEYPCFTCSGNAQTCTSCVSKYTLDGWQCVTTFNFAFFISLNTDLTTFYNNYYKFLLALVNPLSSTNIQPVSISSIISNTPSSVQNNEIKVVISSANSGTNQVNVTGTISTIQNSNSNEVGNQFYGVQSVFNSGSIAGMSIGNYTLSAEGGQVPSQGGGVNTLAIILGICIPVGVIIIGVIVYFVCIRNRNNTPPVVYESQGGASSARQTFELTREQPNI